MTIESELKAAVESKSVIFGTKEALKAVKTQSAKTIVIASNMPASIKQDIKRYADLAGTAIKEFSGSGKQLGVACGKPFAIAALAIVEKKK